MPSSVVVAVRKAVVEGLARIEEFSDEQVAISYGWDPKSKARYQIFTMRPRGDQQPASLRTGRQFRNESGHFQIVIHVEESGADAEAADEKAIAFGQVVEEFIADNRLPETLTGLNWLRMESWEMTGGPTDGRSFISQLIYTATYDARLT